MKQPKYCTICRDELKYHKEWRYNPYTGEEGNSIETLICPKKDLYPSVFSDHSSYSLFRSLGRADWLPDEEI